MASGEGRIERRLLCELTDDDVQSRGRMLAETVVQIDLVMSEKREATKVFNQKLEGLGEEQRKLTKAIRDRAEYRIVMCAVKFHEPCEGIKRIGRLDTGECIEEMPMTDGEKQLHLFASHAELAMLLSDEGEQAPAALEAEAEPETEASVPDPATCEPPAASPLPQCANCNHAGEWHNEEFGDCGMLDCSCRQYLPKQE